MGAGRRLIECSLPENVIFVVYNRLPDMHRNNSIVVIENDPDDQDALRRVFLELGVPNATKFFDSGDTALQYLLTCNEKPFLILSDINMPGMSGLELLKTINADNELKKKCFPFVFLSNATDVQTISKAYGLSPQGYFEKGWNIRTYINTIRSIVDYWKTSKVPAQPGVS